MTEVGKEISFFLQEILTVIITYPPFPNEDYFPGFSKSNFIYIVTCLLLNLTFTAHFS